MADSERDIIVTTMIPIFQGRNLMQTEEEYMKKMPIPLLLNGLAHRESHSSLNFSACHLCSSTPRDDFPSRERAGLRAENSIC